MCFPSAILSKPSAHSTGWPMYMSNEGFRSKFWPYSPCSNAAFSSSTRLRSRLRQPESAPTETSQSRTFKETTTVVAAAPCLVPLRGDDLDIATMAADLACACTARASDVAIAARASFAWRASDVAFAARASVAASASDVAFAARASDLAFAARSFNDMAFAARSAGVAVAVGDMATLSQPKIRVGTHVLTIDAYCEPESMQPWPTSLTLT